MTDKAAISIYNYYNLTDKSAIAYNDMSKSASNMNVSTKYEKHSDGNFKILDIQLNVNIAKNRDSRLYDNYENIKSSFEHEQKHILDLKTTTDYKCSVDNYLNYIINLAQ